MNEPIYKLYLSRSSALAALAALRKLPIEQAEGPHAELLAAIRGAEEQALMESIAARLNPAAPPAE